jgi:hypothetical protein
MDYGNLLVVFTSPGVSGGYSGALRQAGFANHLAAQEGDTVRQTLARALAEGYEYIVTVDEKDGFSADDIAKVADALMADASAVYSGARKSGSEKKSFPAVLFGFLSGIEAGDIETSLYGMSAETCRVMVGMKSREQVFLMNIPLEARANDIKVEEVETGTVSRSQPGWEILTKSFKVYFVFIKFSISADAYLWISLVLPFRAGVMALASGKILEATVLSRCYVHSHIYSEPGAVFQVARRRGAW